MIDKIRMRKIRYDVMEHLELQELIEKVNEVLNNKVKYKEDLEPLKDLQRLANLDLSKNTYEEIVSQLEGFVEDCNNEETIRHLPLLDYIDAVNGLSKDNDSDLDVFETNEYYDLKNFLFQLLQIQKFQYLLIQKSQDLIYIGDDNNIYDRETDKIILPKKQLGISGGEKEETVLALLNTIIDGVVGQKRKYIMSLDFDDDGYYQTMDNESIFDEEDKNEIEKQLKEWIDFLFKQEEVKTLDVNESIDLLDDVSID